MSIPSGQVETHTGTWRNSKFPLKRTMSMNLWKVCISRCTLLEAECKAVEFYLWRRSQWQHYKFRLQSVPSSSSSCCCLFPVLRAVSSYPLPPHKQLQSNCRKLCTQWAYKLCSLAESGVSANVCRVRGMSRTLYSYFWWIHFCITRIEHRRF